MDDSGKQCAPNAGVLLGRLPTSESKAELRGRCEHNQREVYTNKPGIKENSGKPKDLATRKKKILHKHIGLGKNNPRKKSQCEIRNRWNHGSMS